MNTLEGPLEPGMVLAIATRHPIGAGEWLILAHPEYTIRLIAPLPDWAVAARIDKKWIYETLRHGTLAEEMRAEKMPGQIGVVPEQNLRWVYARVSAQ